MLLPQSVIRITLDVREVEKQLSFAIKQNDSARRLIVTLCDMGKPYVVGRGCYAVFSATTSANTTISNGCQIKNNEIIYDLSASDTAVVGRMDCDITLFGENGEVIAAPNFTINVYKSKMGEYAGEVVASNDFSTLQGLIGDANERIAKVDAILESDGKTIEDAFREAISGIDEHAADVVDSLPDTYVDLANDVDQTIKEVLTRTAGASVKDDGAAYIKNVPASALPAAKIIKIGGKAIKCTNMIPLPYFNAQGEYDGLVFTHNADGSIVVNGTATTDVFHILAHNMDIEPGTYYLSGNPSETSNDTIQMYAVAEGGYHWGNRAFTITYRTVVTISIRCLVGTTVRNAVFKPMLNRGPAPMPYEPYFEGLHYAPVTEIESIGVNMFDQTAWFNRHGFTPESNGSYKGKSINVECFKNTSKRSGAIYISYEGRNPSDLTPLLFNVLYTDGTSALIGALNKTSGFNKVIAPTNSHKTVDRIIWSHANGADYYIKDVMISFVDSEYTPYKREVISIPSAVQALEGYGQGNPDNVKECNYIDLANDRFGAYGHIVDGKWVAYDSVQYTPIADVFPSDLIGVQANGTLAFLNENSHDVPSEVEYYINAVSGVMVSGTPALKVGNTIIEEARFKLLLDAIKNSVLPISKIGTATLLASAWKGDTSPYSQVVAIEGVTANSQVDLTPSVEQLAVFHNKDLAFVTENDNGVVTVYAIGDKPTNDYTIQVTITEVYA